jgi:hypothetical protein
MPLAGFDKLPLTANTQKRAKGDNYAELCAIGSPKQERYPVQGVDLKSLLEVLIVTDLVLTKV